VDRLLPWRAGASAEAAEGDARKNCPRCSLLFSSARWHYLHKQAAGAAAVANALRTTHCTFIDRGQKGGEFYTLSCIVRLLTEGIEFYHGLILETLRLANVRSIRPEWQNLVVSVGKGGRPLALSGDLFVSSARFVAEHKQNPSAELFIHGVEKTDETGRLCRMNLAVQLIETCFHCTESSPSAPTAADSTRVSTTALRRKVDFPPLYRFL